MIRVFMLSRLGLFGQGIETLLCREEGVEIVGRETEIEVALAQINRLRPDVVLLDTTLQAGDLASIAARILTAQTSTRVIAMSLEGNTVSVFRGEQRTVHEVQDLMHAITNGTLHSDSSSAKT
jgi:DNA-binding NarL/FixJ family response regulator